MQHHEITLTVHPKLTVKGVLRSFVMPIGIIGVGVMLDSTAMEWIGFIFVLFYVLGIGTIENKKNQALSIEQARERLNEIEVEHT